MLDANKSRRNFIRFSAMATLGVASTKAMSTSATTMSSNTALNVLDFGATGDGVADDTAALRSAINQAINLDLPLRLAGKHFISSSLQVNGNLEIEEQFSLSEISTSSPSIVLFDFDGARLKVCGLNTTGLTLVKTTTDFDRIDIFNCTAQGLADSLSEYLFTTDANVVNYNQLHINNNTTLYMSGMYADGLQGGDLFFTHNVMQDSIRFILRALKGSTTGSRTISFTHNHIQGMNSTLSDQSVAARVVQADAYQLTSVIENYVRDLQTTTAANLLYFSEGDLNCVNNLCYNAHGTEAWIHDKGVGVGTHVIKMNTFDQSGVTDYTLDSAIKIYSGHNFSVSDNDFIGLRSPACWVYESVDIAGIRPENNAITSNKLRNIQYPFAFKLVQPSSNTIIQDNTLFDISNPDGIVQHGESVPKFLFIYVSFNNGEDLENVNIDGNIMMNSPATSEFIEIYRHNVAQSSSIKNLFITNNTANNASTFCSFMGQSIESCTIANNVGKTGCQETRGVNLPIDLRVQNNLF